MSLAPLLHRVEALHDLPGLFAAIGYEPIWQELPDGALVGRAGEFLWSACERRPGGDSAAVRAARLARGGRVAGVVALDAGRRELELAVGYHGDAAHRLRLDHPTPVDLARLERMRPRRGAPALATAARIADALAGQEVGRRFFREFERALNGFGSAYPGAVPAADRHSLALLQLTRVLFLYFVQAKGWLDGRPRFLHDEVDRCLARGGSIHRSLLRPLFFGTLNRPAAERSRLVARLGRIPFLNGGLFEPHPLERRWPADLPTAAWLDAFDGLFERFHFITGSGSEAGIAPDMLGQVFEGVMDPDQRARSGTFYTPAPLVATVVREGFAALLASRLRIADSAAFALLEDPSPAARAVLAHVTLLDPAVGSGAFLLGALDLLAAPWRGDPGMHARRKRAIVCRNLFGVDQNANAVRLAELRLWLEVIAADRSERPQDVTPLPNLDALLRHGDSLADPTGMTWSGGPGGPGEALAGLRHRLATTAGPAKAAIVRALRGAEREAFVHGVRLAAERTAGRIDALLAAARSPTLFGGRLGLSREGRSELAGLRRDAARFRRLLRQAERDEFLPWFHYQSHFADVFAARGGFDLVVGNPPWVRGERLDPGLRGLLEARYRWWRRGGGGRSYPHAPDLVVAFLERATELAAPGGAVAMLVPAKLATAGYATGARAALAAHSTLRLVAEPPPAIESRFDATVYPLIVTYNREPAAAGHLVRTEVGGPGVVPQARLAGGPWVLVPDPLRDALDALRAGQPRLDETLTCHLGLKTGCNRVFLDPPEDVEPELLRWAVRGRDVSAFRVEPRHRLLWTHAESGVPLPALPPRAAAWIASHRTALLARRDLTQGPAWSVFRAGPAASGPRVIWADLARRLEAAVLAGAPGRQAVPLNSCYLVQLPREAAANRLAAWLNSTWIRAAARAGADPASGGYARFNARVVGGLPLPTGVLSDPELADLAGLGQAGRLRQEDLDDHAARFLALGPAHRRALAGSLGARAGARR